MNAMIMKTACNSAGCDPSLTPVRNQTFVYTLTHTDTHTDTHMHTLMHAYTHVCTHTLLHACIPCTHIHTHTSIKLKRTLVRLCTLHIYMLTS